MKIVLGAKNKLGFVNAKIEAPEEGSEGFERWKRCDCMVASWLWNSIAKDLVGVFLYATSSKELWDEISERFGGSNGPMIYQIKRRIALLMQEGLSIASYYTKLKELWDELENIRAIPSCTCGSVKISTEVHNCDKLMQFLMGLNGAYDQVRSQILLHDPLPSVIKAYSMVLRIETPREVQLNIAKTVDATALVVKSQGTRKDFKKYDPRKGHCNYCNMDGHTRAGCFKLIGYPEWFKAKNKNQSSHQQNKIVAQVESKVQSADHFVSDSPWDKGYFTEMSKYEDLSISWRVYKWKCKEWPKGSP
ncbi:uncharacterized protein LOC110643299 isoform X1 [Hevea brasiliensis]|uniref:uncharacterized protein LOC110643299 isoform X1 n=1 Tax=Hevea brasiliensis TaxID=3981 RepID=UPI0025FB4B6C|nr:uncharacterized protein LOC110643299 isoform X1 [Hevea brasiliensis]